MDVPREHRLLTVTEEQFNHIRGLYNATKESLNRDIDCLVEWYNHQPHLPVIELDRNLIERLYIINKCSLERTKQRLDMRYTSRVILPEFFQNRDPQGKGVMNCFQSVATAPLKTLCPDYSRLNIIKIMNPDPELFNAMDFFKLVFMLGEIRLNYDYCLGDKILIDLQGISFGHVLKINPVVVSKSDVTNKKVFGSKLMGIHILNGSSFVEKVVTILKQSLKGKVAERIFAHNSLEDLHKHIPKYVLPEDYGGTGKCFSEVIDDWKDEFNNEKLRQYFLDEDKAMSDESKRPPEAFVNEMLGMPGSFKKLVLD